MKNQMLTGPIPGQSLTMTPKNAPWERPPDITDPEAAIEKHLNRLSQPKELKSIIRVLEMGMPVKPLTEAILTQAVMDGLHSLDVSLIIAPVIHEFISSVAEDVGIPVDKGGEDNEDVGQSDEAMIADRVVKALDSINVKVSNSEDEANKGLSTENTDKSASVGKAETDGADMGDNKGLSESKDGIDAQDLKEQKAGDKPQVKGILIANPFRKKNETSVENKTDKPNEDAPSGILKRRA